MSFLELLFKPANRNLQDVLTKLPKLGIGSRVTRKSWEPYRNSWWEVVSVEPGNADGSVAKAYGVFVWRGRRASAIKQINGTTKKVWRWMPSEAELAAYKPLIRELQRQKYLEKLAAARSTAAGAAETAAQAQQ